MKRRVFNILSVVSLVLAFLLAVAWVRSQLRTDTFVWRQSSSIEVTSARGCVLVTAIFNLPSGRFHLRLRDINHESDRALLFLSKSRIVISEPTGQSVNVTPTPQLLGLGYGFGKTSQQHVTMVLVPLWVPLLVTAAAPLCWIRAWMKRRRKPGQCPSCGYDLRASKGKCPECGAAIESKTA